MVILRYDDPGMPGGYRYVVLNSEEEALQQAAHDQAREDRDFGVVVFGAIPESEGEGGPVIHALTTGQEIELPTLVENTAAERERLEALATLP